MSAGAALRQILAGSFGDFRGPVLLLMHPSLINHI